MLSYLLLLVVGVTDKVGDELYLSRCQGIIAVQAATLPAGGNPQPSPDPTPPDVHNDCKCGGTKKSGDGLGPCVCGPNCVCKPGSEPSPPAAETTCTCRGRCRCDASCPCHPTCTGDSCPTPATQPVAGRVEMLAFVSSSADCRECGLVIEEFNSGKLPPAIRLVHFTAEPLLYGQYKVDRVPMYILLVDGKERNRMVGHVGPAAVNELLQKSK